MLSLVPWSYSVTGEYQNELFLDVLFQYCVLLNW